MSDQIAAIALIHALLLLAAFGYAAFLNQDHVQEWYRPNYVEVTVIGGDLLIWLALLALCAIGVLPWAVAGFYISLHIMAGIPIAAWQQRKRNERRRNAVALDRQLRDRRLEE